MANKSVAGLWLSSACKPTPWSDSKYEAAVPKSKAKKAIISLKKDGFRVNFINGKMYSANSNREIFCEKKLEDGLAEIFGPKLNNTKTTVCCELVSWRHGVDNSQQTVNNDGIRFDSPGQTGHLFNKICGLWNRTEKNPVTLLEFEYHLRLVALYCMEGSDAHERKLALRDLPEMKWCPKTPGKILYGSSLVVQVLWELVPVDDVVRVLQHWEELACSAGATPLEGFVVELVTPNQTIKTWKSGDYRDPTVFKKKNQVNNVSMCIVDLVDRSGLRSKAAIVNIFNDERGFSFSNRGYERAISLPLNDDDFRYVQSFFLNDKDHDSPRGHYDPWRGVPGQGTWIGWYMGHKQMRWFAVAYVIREAI